jgi:DNA-binding MarR family transcriptional regulator
MTDDTGGQAAKGTRPALAAAQARVKALLDTVRQLEEERGAALLRVAELQAAPPEVVVVEVVDDRALARAVVDAMPRHAKRAVSVRVLVVLLALTKGPLSVRELRDVLGVPQASASEWLQEAVDIGVVVLVVSEGDKRQHVAQLTPKGWVYARDRRATKP